MANRPVFVALDRAPFFERVAVDFKFYSGFALSQRHRSIKSLHESFRAANPEKSVLEISTKSEDPLGVNLSAFNLQIKLTDEKSCSIESAYQGSKVFEGGGPFADLMDRPAREAKVNGRLKKSGALVGFNFLGKEFPLEPKNYFYNWLYITALASQPELSAEIKNYDAFTDIEFNPQKSLNTQACAAAIFVGLCRAGLIDAAVEDKENFLKIVYHGE